MSQTSTAQGRYFLLDTPVASPGVCGICGYGGPERRYLDPRLDFEFYGTLIFCEECVKSMSHVFGCLEPAQALALEARVEEAERELVTLRAAVINLENLGDSLSALGYVRDSVVSGTVAGSSDAGADKFPENVLSAEGLSDSADAESSDVSGPDDVRDSQPSKSKSSSLHI